MDGELEAISQEVLKHGADLGGRRIRGGGFGEDVVLIIVIPSGSTHYKDSLDGVGLHDDLANRSALQGDDSVFDAEAYGVGSHGGIDQLDRGDFELEQLGGGLGLGGGDG